MDYSSSPPPEPKGAKITQSLENILLKLGPITEVSFEPFQPEPKQPARAILPPTFPLPPKRHPFDYFSLFFTPELFQTITTNTNRYASGQRLHIKEERAREWTDCLWRNYMCFLELLYIWESTTSLKLRCTGIQTLIKVLCTQLQAIYRSAALNKSSGIAIFRAP